jgi:hypothetical protein
MVVGGETAARNEGPIDERRFARADDRSEVLVLEPDPDDVLPPRWWRRTPSTECHRRRRLSGAGGARRSGEPDGEEQHRKAAVASVHFHPRGMTMPAARDVKGAQVHAVGSRTGSDHGVRTTEKKRTPRADRNRVLFALDGERGCPTAVTPGSAVMRHATSGCSAGSV